jgi:hypothetical protein
VKSTTRGKSNLWKWLLGKNVGKNEYKLYFCPMYYVFRYKKNSRKLIVGFSSVGIWANVCLLLSLLYKNDTSVTWMVFLLFSALGMIALLGLLAYNVYIWQLIVDDTGVTKTNWRTTEHLDWDEIKGFRYFEGGNIVIEPISPQNNTIIIRNDIAQADLLVDILGQKYSDLNLEEKSQTIEEILNNPQYGATEEARENFLKKTRQKAGAWSLAAVLVTIIPLFIPHPTLLELLLAMACPFILLAVSLQSGGLIHLFAEPKQSFANLSTGMLLSPLLFLYVSATKSTLLGHVNIVYSTCFFFLYGGVLLIFTEYKIQRPVLMRGRRLLIVIIAFCYTNGTTTWLNSALDNGAYTTVPVQVVIKGRRSHFFYPDTYYAKVRYWREATLYEVPVTPELYEQIDTNSPLLLLEKPGFLDGLWIEGAVSPK